MVGRVIPRNHHVAKDDQAGFTDYGSGEAAPLKGRCSRLRAPLIVGDAEDAVRKTL